MMTPSAEIIDVWTMLKALTAERTHQLNWLRWHPSELNAGVAGREGQLPPPLAPNELEELRAAHTRWRADEASLSALELLGDPKTRVIITGQQPGLLGGPLLVQYKTLAAIDLARRLKERYPERNWVPVFWVASEDHDFDEIRRVFWPGHSGQLEEFLLQQSGWLWGQMIGRIPTGTILGRLKDLIARSTFKTEFNSDILRLLEEVYDGDSDLETGFSRLLLRLFAGTGLVVVSPLMEWVRRRAVPVLQHEFQHPGRSSRMIIERGEAIKAAGFNPTVHRAPESINAFWVDEENRRYTLRLEGDEVLRALPQGEAVDHIDQPPLPVAELERMLKENPSQFSTNVVTRPLVQDSALPVVAQVAGPGEVSYLAQVEAVYEDFGVFRPVRYPRPQVTLIEPRVARNLEKYRIDLNTMFEMDAVELVNTVVRRDLQTIELREIDQVRHREEDEIKTLKEKFGSGSPAIESAFDKLLQMMEKGYARIVERMLYQRQQDEHSLGQAIALLSNSLRPNDQSQGRELNPIVPFAINYGMDWVLRLAPLLKYDYREPMQLIHLAQLATVREPEAREQEEMGAAEE